MTMRRVDHETVNTSLDQFVGALAEVSGGANRRGHSQTTEIIFCRRRILDGLLYVLHRNETLDSLVAVNHEQLLNAMLLQDGLGLFERRADRDRYQRLTGHHF